MLRTFMRGKRGKPKLLFIRNVYRDIYSGRFQKKGKNIGEKENRGKKERKDEKGEKEEGKEGSKEWNSSKKEGKYLVSLLYKGAHDRHKKSAKKQGRISNIFKEGGRMFLGGYNIHPWIYN